MNLCRKPGQLQFRKIRWAVILCVGVATMAVLGDHIAVPAFGAGDNPPADLQKTADAPINALPTVESNNQVLKITLATVCGVGVTVAVTSWMLFRKPRS